MASKILKNIRFNPVTGQCDYYFPMEISDRSVLEYARHNGLEIGWAKLGCRTFWAAMIPCMRTTYDAKGHQVYLETPSEEQRCIFNAYAADEKACQEETRQDSRCRIPNTYGTGFKGCPHRIPNPAYTPGSNQPKTLPNRCEGCSFEHFRYGRSTVPFSSLDYEDEEGKVKPYEALSPRGYYAGDRYEEHAVGFVDFVRARRPKLVPLAEKLLQGFNLTEASAELGKSTSTAFSQREVLQELLKEYLQNAVI